MTACFALLFSGGAYAFFCRAFSPTLRHFHGANIVLSPVCSDRLKMVRYDNKRPFA